MLDFCGWVYTRLKTIKENEQECDKLIEMLEESKDFYNDNELTLIKCARVVPIIEKIDFAADHRSREFESLKRATEKLPKNLAEILASLTRAGQVIEGAISSKDGKKSKSLKSKLMIICKAKDVC